MRAHCAVALAALGISGLSGAATGSLENPQPNSPQSGIGVVSGWACPPVGQVQVSFDGNPKIIVPYGSPRADTASVCGSQTNSGFGLLFNYNTLGPGTHSVTAYADGVAVGTAQFTVSTFGQEFLRDIQATANIGNFPAIGKRATVIWQQATQNFAISATDGTPAAVAGNYTGLIEGANSNCGSNGGSNGNFAFSNVQYAMNLSGDSVSITAMIPNAKPSSCTLAGTLLPNTNGAQFTVQTGAFTCDDGSQGQWTSNGLVFSGVGFLAQSQTTNAVNGCVGTLRLAGVRN
jgi:hypothetical protein